MILFGGANGSTYDNDTWSWSGTAWSQLTPTNSPSVRDSSRSMAYDPTLSELVLFGGLQRQHLSGRHLDLERHHVGPAELTTSPPLVGGATMAYDTATSDLVLFAGFEQQGNQSDTWVIGAPIVSSDLANFRADHWRHLGHHHRLRVHRGDLGQFRVALRQPASWSTRPPRSPPPPRPRVRARST